MQVTAIGPIAEPLDLFVSMLDLQPAWRDWAGTEHAKRVHLSENRSQMEIDSGSPLWFNTTLQQPFSIIWMSRLEIDPKRCLYDYSVLMMFQDATRERDNHNESARVFTSCVGAVLEEIDTHIREADALVPNVDNYQMLSMPTRLQVDEAQPNNDFWTTTFEFQVNP